MLVIPDFCCCPRAVKEHQVRRNRRVWSEHPVGQPDDRVDIEVSEEFLLDTGADTIPEESPVRHDHPSASRAARGCRVTSKLTHDQLKKQQCRLGCLSIVREVTLNPLFLFPAEWWICEDDVYSILLANFGELVAERVARVYLWCIEAMEKQIH